MDSLKKKNRVRKYLLIASAILLLFLAVIIGLYYVTHFLFYSRTITDIADLNIPAVIDLEKIETMPGLSRGGIYESISDYDINNYVRVNLLIKGMTQ